MKSCSRKDCKQINPQPLSNFHKHKPHKDGLASQCKFCKSEHEKTKYKDPKFKEYNRNRPHGRFYVLHKKDHCEKCGFIPEDMCQLDVDHVDGNNKNSSPDNLQTLCANCHRLKTKLSKNNRWNK